MVVICDFKATRLHDEEHVSRGQEDKKDNSQHVGTLVPCTQ